MEVGGATERRAASRLPPATVLLSLAIVAEIFSGNWGYVGTPGALDRALLVTGLVALVLGGIRSVSDRGLRLRPVHLVLLVAATYATTSSIAAHTFDVSKARFALLDRFGIIPFLMFCLAPLVFGRTRQRNFFLGVLVVTGAYLSVTAVLEGVGLKSLVWPSYIVDPSVGLHYGRARGPFVEAVADGLAMYMCAVAAAIGFTIWRRRWMRIACGAVIVLSAFGILFTVTRAVWIAAVVGTVASMLVVPRLRRLIFPVLMVGVVCVVAAFLLVPGFSAKADSRVQDQSPVWDRYNTNSAAVRMVEARPLFGFGWQTFPAKGVEYMRQADTYPLTGATLEVHNVFLSHAAELGLVGSLLWAVGLFGAIGGAIVRKGPPELAPWRVGLLAIFVNFLIVANFGPLSYPFPNLLLWTWAGIAGSAFFLASAPPATTRVSDHPQPLDVGWRDGEVG